MSTSSVMRLARAALAVGLGLAAISATNAQSLDSVFSADERRIKLAQQSQERIDNIVEDTRSALDQYRSVTKELDGLNVYNTLLQRQIDNQNAEIADLTNSIDQVTVIERQIMPLMLDMIQGLRQFVELDVPFLPEERQKRLNFLDTLIERSDVSVAEKFRRVMEAYQIESDYGRNIESYKGLIEVGEGTREVDFLRVGRVALLYQTEDGAYAGAWDQQARQWMPLDSTYRNQVRQALRVAKKQVAPDLMMLPIAAPEEAR